jgi:hypothetical protein
MTTDEAATAAARAKWTTKQTATSRLRSKSAIKTDTIAFKIGDNVRVIKRGTQTGKTAVVTKTDWKAKGILKVKLDTDGSIKAYLSHEVALLGELKRDKKKLPSSSSVWNFALGLVNLMLTSAVMASQMGHFWVSHYLYD